MCWRDQGQSLFMKCPAHHSADITMLRKKEELGEAFVNPVSSEEKSIDCLHVDGASGEGPLHHEVQFYWTEWQLHRRMLAMLVTTCNMWSKLNE